MPRVLWFMHALGKAGLPTSVSALGRDYALEKTVKHDFWAATGFYRSADGTRAVVKINRPGIIGRWLGYRERRAYAKLQDLPNIPRLLGEAMRSGIVHSYAEGEPLSRESVVPDAFFDQLIALVEELNRRGIAYVDMNKPQNILLGVDGRPHLIDFQIHFDAGAWWPGWLGRRLLRSFYNGDVYHVLKNKKRFRPDQLTDAERARLENRGLLHRVHRAIMTPIRDYIRRPILKWLSRTGRVADSGSD
jgi:hypothetical protein